MDDQEYKEKRKRVFQEFFKPHKFFFAIVFQTTRHMFSNDFG
jgi:hypothetical protein